LDTVDGKGVDSITYCASVPPRDQSAWGCNLRMNQSPTNDTVGTVAHLE